MSIVSKKSVIKKYIWLAIIYITAHMMICVISGQWWDDWCYWTNGTEHLKEAYFESGMPLQAYNIMSVMWLPNWGYRIVAFFLFLLVGLLFYEIIRKVDFLSEEDAYFIAAIAMTVPVNDARVVLNCFGYTLEIALFMIGFFLATKMDNIKGIKRYLLRILSLLFLFFSYTMESLLVFTGLIWIYFFYAIWINNNGEKLLSKISLFFRCYWDYFSLPFAFFILKRMFFKPYGRYAGYNSITLKSLIKGTLLSPYSALKTGAYIAQSYILQIGVVSVIALGIIIAAYVFLSRKHTKEAVKNEGRDSNRKILLILLLGFVVYYAGIYAYIIVRGGSSLDTTGVGSRDSLLAGFGIGVIVVAFSRLLPLKRTIQNLIPIVLIVLGIFHFNDWYLNYQEDWYHQRELASAMEENDGFEDDNTILCDFSTVSPIGGTRFYSVNGMSYIVTGKMDKFFFSGIGDLKYELTSHDFTAGGYNCNDYDDSDTSIDGVLFVNNASISNVELMKLRFYEMFDQDIFRKDLASITDYRYVKISKDTSDRIYEAYAAGELTTSETLRMIVDKQQ